MFVLDRRLKLLTILLLITSCFYGCITNRINNTIRPEWVEHPPVDESGEIIYGVGSSNLIFSIDSNSQREKAIKAAASIVAMQMGVKVYTMTKNTNGKFSYYSIQLSNGNVVSIIIRDYWNDSNNDMLYVLVETL